MKVTKVSATVIKVLGNFGEVSGRDCRGDCQIKEVLPGNCGKFTGLFERDKEIDSYKSMIYLENSDFGNIFVLT